MVSIVDFVVNKIAFYVSSDDKRKFYIIYKLCLESDKKQEKGAVVIFLPILQPWDKYIFKPYQVFKILRRRTVSYPQCAIGCVRSS